jgi:hypothetical protein
LMDKIGFEMEDARIRRQQVFIYEREGATSLRLHHNIRPPNDGESETRPSIQGLFTHFL